MTTTTEFTKADLPELPNNAGYPFPRWVNVALRDYGRHCVAASRKKLMEQEPVGVTDMAGDVHWKRGAPIQAKLYAAPMPQANESEVARAFDIALDALSKYQNDWDTGAAWPYAEGERIAMECAVESVRDALKDARAVLAGEPAAQAEQPKQAQAVDERELFHAWFDTYADPHSGRVERNIKRKAAWGAWQARAALAQAQVSEKAASTGELE